MSSVNKILLWIRICNFISYTVMYSFVEFESLRKWLVLPLLTCRFLTFAYIVSHNLWLFLSSLILLISRVLLNHPYVSIEFIWHFLFFSIQCRNSVEKTRQSLVMDLEAKLAQEWWNRFKATLYLNDDNFISIVFFPFFLFLVFLWLKNAKYNVSCT